MRKRLFRSTNDRILGGVCAGLAEYAQVDTGLLRFLAVVAILATGVFPGIIIYILCVLIIPSDKVVFNDGMHSDMDEESPDTESNPENTRLFIGVSLIIIGMLSLAKLLFNVGWQELKYFIPVVLVVIGAVLIYRSRGNSE